MSHDGNKTEQLYTLLDAWCDGVLSDEGSAELNRLLRDDPRLCWEHLCYMELHGAIRFGLGETSEKLLAELSDELAPQAAISRKPSTADGPPASPVLGFLCNVLPRSIDVRYHPGRFLGVSAALTLVAWLGFCVFIRPALFSDLDVAVRPADPMPPLVGELRRAVDARWAGDPQNAPFPGMHLPQGRSLTLESGLAEIVLKGGAAIVIEGPATFTLHGVNDVWLEHGRLTARVAAEAKGFSISAPDGVRVTDLGTEFGMAIDEDRAKEVHVFEGKVRFEVDLPGRSPRRQLLTAGDRLRVAADGRTLNEPDQPPTEFVRAEALPDAAEQIAKMRYEKWLAYSTGLRGDPDLLAYYTFGKEDDAPQKLPNLARATAGRHDGRLGGGQADLAPTWTTGRWPAKGALRFDASRATRVVVPHHDELNPLRAITIATWVKPDSTNVKMHVLNKAVAPRVTYALVWIGRADGAFGTAYFNWGRGGRLVPDALPRATRWTHLAVTVTADEEMLFYVDGIRAAGKPYGRPLPTSGDVWIGSAAWGPDTSFSGWIDELALFRRALSEPEIRQMYQAGRP